MFRRSLHHTSMLMSIALVILTVCGKDSPTQPKPPEPPARVATSIQITPSSTTLNALGNTIQITAKVYDQSNVVMEGALVTWSTSDESVATVSAGGLVTAVRNGVARITATSGSATSSMEVTVSIREPSPDREVLVALFQATGGTGWKSNLNWLSDKPIEEWYGVNTDEEGRVTDLNLGSNGLIGHLPVALSRLSYLEGLALDGNRLAGTIPPELGRLVQLKYLYLLDNHLTGFIPPELGELDRLIHLCLNGNRLTGSITPALGKLSSLKWLHLHQNIDLAGTLPVELTNLNLDALLLQGTQVCLPNDADFRNWLSSITDARVRVCKETNNDRFALEAFFRSTNGANWKNARNWMTDLPLGEWYGVNTDSNGRVVSLVLTGQELSGSIPPEFGLLEKLTYLDLRRNRLTGNIPVEIGRLTGLTYLSLQSNHLLGSIPGDLSNLAYLTELHLSRNLLSGSIPGELGGMGSLELIRLRSNRLTGEIPSELGHLANLTELELSHNSLSGGIPSELSRLTNLTELRLNSNQLSGSIPSELGQISSLTELDLTWNQLSGSIPTELGQLARLTSLNIGHNQLSGSIPPELGQLTKLESFSVTHNHLSGSIPPEFGNLSNLGSLVLQWNRLSGSIPSELGQLANLYLLSLASNQLSGRIPNEIGQMSNLEILYLNVNPLLSGPVPDEMTALIKLKTMQTMDTQLCFPDHVEFHTWLESIEYYTPDTVICNPDRAPLTALYHDTGGEYWYDGTEWLSSKPLEDWFGVETNTANRVVSIDLKNNNLIGPFPSELDGLDNLRRLDLSGNPALVDTLPHELASLSLEFLKIDGSGLCVPASDEFQHWLMGISQVSGVTDCDDIVDQESDDRSVLVAWYNATDGPNWKEKSNWLSHLPLDRWDGVTTDSQGRVTKLVLDLNNINGPLLPELGLLSELTHVSLVFNSLTGPIPTEFGQLSNLKELRLNSNELTGRIPSDLGSLAEVTRLSLAGNNLTGNIPPELSQLTELNRLDLGSNELNGSIPVQLSNLTKLESLNIRNNQLTDQIPPELGRLGNLRILSLHSNQLTGQIPQELGYLINLTSLNLSRNGLTGHIPRTLGWLHNLEFLHLEHNKLDGTIPSGLGNLGKLRRLFLDSNQLTGDIPGELGQLSNLEYLQLTANNLSGGLPYTFGGLTKLNHLFLDDNAAMTGPIPESLTTLGELEIFTFDGTELCAPADPRFVAWFRGLQFELQRQISRWCAPSIEHPGVYLTQAVQSFEYNVPMVAGRPALLRVFFTSENEVVNKPAVRAAFYLDGAEPLTIDIPPGPAKVPLQIDESSLDISANAVVPAEMVREGLEVVVEVDPSGMFYRESGTVVRVPETGRIAVDVRSMPPFELTLVPLLWTENPDYSVVTRTEGLTTDDDVFRLVRALLPIEEFELRVLDPVMTSYEPVAGNGSEVLKELEVIRALDGTSGFLMGIGTSGGGASGTNEFVSFSQLDPWIMAHELGHNLSLRHAPCGNVSSYSVDRYYPHDDGSIGVWGYDLERNRLVDPMTPDMMGYCGLTWISGFHLNKMFHYRIFEEENYRRQRDSTQQSRSLLLWGGLDVDGQLSLEPTFAVDAKPILPMENGPYRLSMRDASGNTAFQMHFNMSETADGDGGSYFVFTVPVQSDWPDRLTHITLSGPEGFVEMTRESGRSTAIALDQFTGQVRGILRDWPEPGTDGVSGRTVLPEPGLNVVISKGIPKSTDW